MTSTITLCPTKNGTDILSDTAHACPCCARMTCWFRNVAGRSTCLECAEVRS